MLVMQQHAQHESAEDGEDANFISGHGRQKNSGEQQAQQVGGEAMFGYARMLDGTME